ncbi:AmmeMemoRadiSam system radical SAM enzyme [Planctomycetales bacterium]|nr:AmmeMemoRadiSam system radical SAM enzyme [Planctomycetales bacterium]
MRRNDEGRVVLASYGQVTGFAVDPIEKKPLNHFYPGSQILSFGSIGCNLACRFCQNASTAQSRNFSLLSQPVRPEEIVQIAEKHNCIGVAFTYNEPIISLEYVLDVAAACRENHLKTVAVSNGYIAEKFRSTFFAAMDAANIDLKSFSEEFYQKYCSATLQPVLETLKYLAQSSTLLEITTLLIPSLNDSEKEITALCCWLRDNIGQDVPVHFSAFHPANRLLDLSPTPPETLLTARQIALAAGLRYVYTGNIFNPEGETTFCPRCGQAVISRNRCRITDYRLDKSGHCTFCGNTIYGCF